MFIFYLFRMSRCYYRVTDVFSNIAVWLLLLYLQDVVTNHPFLSARDVHLEQHLSALLLTVMILNVLVNHVGINVDKSSLNIYQFYQNDISLSENYTGSTINQKL